MGLNILVVNKSGGRHPQWDWSRLGGDRGFAELAGNLPRIDENWTAPPDYEWHTRPANFDVWRKAISEQEWPNAGRFEGFRPDGGSS